MKLAKVEEMEDQHVRHIHLSEHLSNEGTHLANIGTSIMEDDKKAKQAAAGSTVSSIRNPQSIIRNQ
jgi:hypothetical protein